MSTLPPILRKLESLGYKVFEDGDYNLNLFGIRSKVRDANAFDDNLGCAYKKNDLWRVEWWEATTDPGTWYLVDNPMNKAGTAILKPGQYRAYRIDKHNGKYDALCQREAPVTVYRDNNRDKVLNMDESTLVTGSLGINIHRRRGTDDTVDGASAGCQVFRYGNAFDRMMHLARMQIEKRGWDVFTYTLVDEEDVL